MKIPFLKIIFALVFFLSPFVVSASTMDNMSGWAWSSNIGWVSFNCTNDNSCATSNYGVNKNIDNTLTGYAWSSNIGWIKFGGLDGFPGSTGNAKIDGNKMVGWVKALSASGGWDGWISLSGTTYGVTMSGHTFSGYAWGSDVLGWLDFSQVTIKTHTVTGSKVGGTSLSTFTPTTKTINDGSTTTLTATAETGYAITSISGSGCGGTTLTNPTSPATFTTGPITSDCMVTANFSPNTRTVTARVGSGGHLDRGSQIVNYGSTTYFTITSDPGYSILTPEGDCPAGTFDTNTDVYTTGEITTDCTVTVSFSLQTRTVTATAGTGGHFDANSKIIDYSSTTTLTATADPGYHITSISGCDGTALTNPTSPATFTTGEVTTDCTVTANFTGNTLTASLSVHSSSGPVPLYSHLTATRTGGTATGDIFYQFKCKEDSSWSTSQSLEMYSCNYLTDGTYIASTKLTQGGVTATASQTIVVASPDLTPSVATPVSAISGKPQTYTAIITNIGNASTTGTSFPYFFQVQSVVDNGAPTYQRLTYPTTGLTYDTIGTLSIGESATATSPAITFTSDNTHTYVYSVRVCANKTDASHFGSMIESNYDNNCGDWTTVNVIPLRVTASISGDVHGHIVIPLVNSVNYGDTTRFEIASDTNYSASATTTCDNGGVLSGTMFTTGKIYSSCSVSVSFTYVTPLFPDLIISTDSNNNYIFPASATAGMSQTFDAYVSNNGNKVAIATKDHPIYNIFQYDEDNNHDDSTSPFPVSISAGSPVMKNILPGNRKTFLTSDSHIFNSVGTRYVRACTDLNVSFVGTITESNPSGTGEDNNCSPWIAVNVVAAPYVDLTVDSVTPTTIGADTQTVFAANVVNSGTASVSNTTNVSYLFEYDENSDGDNNPDTNTSEKDVLFSIVTSKRTIAAGDSISVSSSHTFTPGVKSIRVCADTDTIDHIGAPNAISELIEDNNCGPWTTITVGAPDLVADQVVPATNRIRRGVEQTFSSVIRNVGTYPTLGSSINHLWQYDENADGNNNHKTGPISTDVITTSGALDAITGSIPVSDEFTFGSTGDKYVRVCADSDDQFTHTVTESNEDNNCSTWTKITVTRSIHSAQYPDLSVGTISISNTAPYFAVIQKNSNVAWYNKIIQNSTVAVKNILAPKAYADLSGTAIAGRPTWLTTPVTNNGKETNTSFTNEYFIDEPPLNRDLQPGVTTGWDLTIPVTASGLGANAILHSTGDILGGLPAGVNGIVFCADVGDGVNGDVSDPGQPLIDRCTDKEYPVINPAPIPGLTLSAQKLMADRTTADGQPVSGSSTSTAKSSMFKVLTGTTVSFDWTIDDGFGGCTPGGADWSRVVNADGTTLGSNAIADNESGNGAVTFDDPNDVDQGNVAKDHVFNIDCQQVDPSSAGTQSFITVKVVSPDGPDGICSYPRDYTNPCLSGTLKDNKIFSSPSVLTWGCLRKENENGRYDDLSCSQSRPPGYIEH